MAQDYLMAPHYRLPGQVGTRTKRGLLQQVAEGDQDQLNALIFKPCLPSASPMQHQSLNLLLVILTTAESFKLSCQSSYPSELGRRPLKIGGVNHWLSPALILCFDTQMRGDS